MWPGTCSLVGGTGLIGIHNDNIRLLGMAAAGGELPEPEPQLELVTRTLLVRTRNDG